MLYKIIHHLVDIDADSLPPPRPSTRGHPKRFLQLQERIDAYSYSFFPSNIKLWNSLLTDDVNISDLNQFKQRITGLLF